MENLPIFCKTHAPSDEESFWRYPSHKVLATFDEAEAASSAISSLQRSGIQDSAIEVECGRSGEERIDFSGEKHGILSQFLRSLQALSAEHSYLEHYQKELSDGHYLVEVKVSATDEKAMIAQILHDHGGRRVTYFGNWIIEEIANKVSHTETGGYGISRTAELPFSKAVEKIKESLAAEGFGVLTEIDMKAKFKEKLGEEFENYLILGACNPSYAFKALNMDMDLGLLLPCNVVVYEKEGKTVVAAIDPVKMMSVADNADLNAIAVEVETKLQKAIDTI